MARTEHYYTKLEEGNVYHIYNRMVDRKPLFTEIRNYHYFLSRIVKYLYPYLDVYAFCLLDNHFHLLVKIKELQKDKVEDSATLKELPNLELPNLELPNLELPNLELPNLELPKVKLPYLIVAGAFRRMFQSYAMAFNKQENRIGTVFQEPFKRSLVDSEEYLLQLIYYIHFNSQKHGLVSDYRSYPHSSYHEYKNQVSGFCAQQEIIELLGGYNGFMDFHNEKHDIPKNKYIIEME